MIFKSRQKRQTLDNVTIKLCDSSIVCVKEMVFLGVILDEHWNKSALRILHFSPIYPYLLYCISVWGWTYFVLQKRSTRFDGHTDPISKEFNVLLEFKVQIRKIMFQYKAGMLHISFDKMFLLTSQVRGYNTRSAYSFYVPKCWTNIRQFSFRFRGPNVFNLLSSDILNSTGMGAFNHKLKHYLLTWFILYLCL